MSGCLSSSMTGSTDAGPLQPQEDPAPLPPATRSPATLDLRPVSEDNSSLARRGHHRHQPRRKMTSGPASGQAIQLTPLWEHVVRTRRFPSEVDTQATFVEISERLRDPEWEVRQHALRVLMDVLPTLNADVVDKVMQPVVPELINNLGHPAPAVRKGALDTLRVYLVHSPNRDSMVKNILHDGLNRPDAHNPFQTNVTTGVILSAPLLLFPSSNSPPPTAQVLKDATIAFASRLVQVPHQEAVIKSLVKIRDMVGEEEFESYLADYDDKLKKNIDVLSKIYNIKPSRKKREKNCAQDIMKEQGFDKSWDSDSDTSGIAEEEDEAAMPPARVVLETEIKFNEETAITMTILEEKDEDDSENDDQQNIETTKNDTKNNEAAHKNLSSPDRHGRKTPRRVHFGGEIVKLRTPDSDETESIERTSKTRIPLPVSPVTKMPETTRKRPSSQPCSPHMEKRGSRRASRSASSSPKRETYTHNAQLSPKKSILTRTGGPLIVINPATEETKNARNSAKERRSGKVISENGNSRVISIAQEIEEASKKEEMALVQAAASSADKAEKSAKNENNRTKSENEVSRSSQDANTDISKDAVSVQELAILEKNQANATNSNRSDIVEDPSKQERNFTPTRSSPKRKTVKESRERGCANDEKPSEGDFPHESKMNARANDFAFGSPVNDANECDTRMDPIDDLMNSNFLNDNEQVVHTFDVIANDRVVTSAKYDDGEFSVRDSDGEGQKGNSQHDGKSASEGNGSITCSSSEGEGKPQEPNWEELGLVGQEVLDDLHNKIHALINRDYRAKSWWLLCISDNTICCTACAKIDILLIRVFHWLSCQFSNRVERSQVVTHHRKIINFEATEELELNLVGWLMFYRLYDGAFVSSVNVCARLNVLTTIVIVAGTLISSYHSSVVIFQDDWRARVRGLERVASALRTSSALIAIESRLGSLLHAVLGGERSCRVAAAGLAVAKVVVAGVSEDALRKKLPQLAWGLARQGGSSAAQLARIAMLRLKPSLLLDQLLQTHCLCARNAKTRENALQLLIFSLVTFPSTEFNLDMVASRVATMVVDQRRRVRQAALDTLAVLGQIYDPEEVLEAGKRAAEGCADAEAMIAAIRARLARKSLPLVSADGLVVYGLQISPTVQIATGPDVDWIVAGSGSVSPGTGCTRGQIIATSRSAQGRASRNESVNNYENPWIERPSLVTLGVGLPSKAEQSTAWQILPSQTNNDNENEIKGLNGRNINAGVNLRFEEQQRSSYTLSNQSYDIVGTDAKNHKEVLEQKTRNRKDVKELENANLRGESKIPILSTRSKPTVTQNREQAINSEHVNSNSRKQTKDALDNNKNRINPRQENLGSYATHQRRKRLQREENQALNQTFDSHYGNYHSTKALGATNREYSAPVNRQATFSDDNLHSYGRFVDTNKFTDKNENLDSTGGRQRSLPRNMQQQALVETYSSIYERQRKLMDRNSYRPLQTAPSYYGYHESQNLDPQGVDNERNVIYRSKDRRTKDATVAEQRTEMDLVSSDPQNGRPFSENFTDPYRRRLRSLSPSQLHRSRQFVKLASSKFHAASMYDM
ncbi:hypothetical protein X777_10555 [Ooceraea biroi]|uniref:TOG domain-containing protein n=1 Tax=Ooceraea biroi TaxID=2015173 RepID=A0A026W4E7_OOCBI|nr:hypothetical protein X777_10555 [Ooceraea biroi]